MLFVCGVCVVCVSLCVACCWFVVHVMFACGLCDACLLLVCGA